MSQVRSQDGTTIAYARSGSGPALILVDGALCSRAFGPSAKLAPLLARHFTVYAYDRRGRGQSGDTQSYSPAREVEDTSRRSLRKPAGRRFSSGCRRAGRWPSKPRPLASRSIRWLRTSRRTWTTPGNGAVPRTRVNSNVSLRAETAAAR